MITTFLPVAIGCLALGRLQVVKGRDHPFMAREGDGPRLMGADGDHHIVKLLLQLARVFSLLIATPGLRWILGVCLKTGDLPLPDGLGQTLPGNGLAQLAADLVGLFKDMGLDPVQGQLPGHRHAAGPPPMIATFLPVVGRAVGGSAVLHRATEDGDIDG